MKDEAGKALPGIVVHLAADSFPPLGLKYAEPFEVSVLTDKTGSFQATGLPAAKLRICALRATGDQIGSCPTPGDRTIVTLTAGQKATVPPLVMKTGHRLALRVNDPGGLLTQHVGKTQGAFFLAGFAAAGMGNLPMRVVSTDSKGQNLEALIPFDTNVNFTAHSPFFSMKDEGGADVDKDKGMSRAVTVSRGSAGPGLSVTITGINPGKKP